MIYIVSLTLVFFLSIYYDAFNGKSYRNGWYAFLLIWFICISGFQYMVGTDTPSYMQTYESMNIHTFKFEDIYGHMGERKQPGWMLYFFVCRIFTDNFLLPKMIQAIFLNVSVFAFFKRESKVPFMCVLFYAVFSYLVLNFNVMRQSFAIGFALYAYSYLKNKRYKMYYLFAFFAFMFHNSAAILFICPLFRFFRYNKFVIICIFSVIVSLVLVISSIGIDTVISNVMALGLLGDDMQDVAMAYMQGEKLGIQGGVGIFSIQRLIVFAVVLYYIIKRKDIFWGTFGLIYCTMLIIIGFMPILWRFQLYFDFGFYLAMADVTKLLSFEPFFARMKAFMPLFSIMLLCYFPFRGYLTQYEGSKFRYIDQYYPYHSVFDPKVNYDRLNYFK